MLSLGAVVQWNIIITECRRSMEIVVTRCSRSMAIVVRARRARTTMAIERLHRGTTISIERRHSVVKKLLYSIDKKFLKFNFHWTLATNGVQFSLNISNKWCSMTFQFFSINYWKKIFFKLFFSLNSIWCWCSMKIELH